MRNKTAYTLEELKAKGYTYRIVNTIIDDWTINKPCKCKDYHCPDCLDCYQYVISALEADDWCARYMFFDPPEYDYQINIKELFTI